MAPVAIIVVLALLQYIYFSLQVGKARGTYEVGAPAVSGHPIFERHYRVQMNTLEQLIVFIPAVFLFGYYGNAMVAAALGAVYLVGRFLFASSYVADPAKRSLGFMLSFLPTVVLLVGGLLQAVRVLV
jgi:uncharacterized MAPEG superfamily protein